MTLTLSDVIGDDLEVIASGPTVPRDPTPEKALDVLKDLGLLETDVGREVERILHKPHSEAFHQEQTVQPLNLVIGNNSTAVDSAGILAEQLGYSHAMISGNQQEDAAEAVGRWLANTAVSMRDNVGPDCLISGGESTVELAPTGAARQRWSQPASCFGCVGRARRLVGLGAYLGGAPTGKMAPPTRQGPKWIKELQRRASLRESIPMTICAATTRIISSSKSRASSRPAPREPTSATYVCCASIRNNEESEF